MRHAWNGSMVVGLLWFLFMPEPVLKAQNWTVYLRKAGPVRIGMSIAEVRKAIQDPEAVFKGDEKVKPDNAGCAYLQSARIPEGIGLMFQKGRLVRIDVDEPGIRTASGAQIGDSEERIMKLYPARIHVARHPYLPETGHYLNYISGDARDRGYGIVFETADGIVRQFRVGTLDAISLVEGCN